MRHIIRESCLSTIVESTTATAILGTSLCDMRPLRLEGLPRLHRVFGVGLKLYVTKAHSPKILSHNQIRVVAKTAISLCHVFGCMYCILWIQRALNIISWSVVIRFCLVMRLLELKRKKNENRNKYIHLQIG